jgi:3-isopropylmalate/(R)-2-methylmalate dehydratase small subunit
VSRITSPEAEEPLPTLEGRAWSFGLELSAAQILDESHTGLDPLNARHHLFASIDAALAARLAPDDVIVAEAMTGSADTARVAVAALAAAGVTALVARVFSSALVLAARTHGLATVVVDAPSFIRTDDRLRIDLDAAKVVNLSSGDRTPIRNLDDVGRTILRTALANRPSSR